MNIPHNLQENLRGGRVVLVLGAGASIESRNLDNKKCPSTTDLARAISERFLGGQYLKAPLATVAQYAMSEASQSEVESFIADSLHGLQPTGSHKRLPDFVWKGIATTNYDTLVEQAYQSSDKPQQSLRSIADDHDRFDADSRDTLLLLKLHGCVTRPTTKERPLILTVDQYLTHKMGRNRLFDKLEEWAYENTLLFVGHSLEDSDIREILLSVSQLSEARPRYYVVAPDVDEIKSRFWESRAITPLTGTFNDLMQEVSRVVPKQIRSLLQSSLDLEHPISQRFAVAGAQCSNRLRQFFETHAEYVGHIERSNVVDPIDFYRGSNPRWSAVERNLDVPRQLQDALLSDSILIESEAHRLRLVVLKGPAGSGKSVLLQRLAWTASNDWNKLCVFLREEGKIDPLAISELLEKCREPVYLFIDNAADHVRDIERLSRELGDLGGRVCCVVAERMNEWNNASVPVDHLVEDEHVLAYLSNKEIDGLLELLEKNGALGSLCGKSYSERKQAFAEQAGRQLLVALHEATYGRPFVEIIEDEFHSIEPAEARDLYLSVCVLNRFNSPVRAGAIARMHDLPFEEFRTRFFRPLEHVVFTEVESGTLDHWYKARHPHIADIVFQHAFRSQEERYDKYIACLRGLNPGYSSDRSLVRSLIRARSLVDNFSNHELVRNVYRLARSVMSEDAYVFQQEAIYEMVRPNPNYQASKKLLDEALERSPNDASIQHSLAELHVKIGDASTEPHTRNKAWREAEKIIDRLKSQRPDAFPYATQVKIGTSRLKLMLEGDSSVGGTYESVVKSVETSLSEGLQRFPDDPHLRQAEASLADILADDQRVKTALEGAFAKNTRSTYVAKRLATLYASKGDDVEAERVLATALSAFPNSPPLHYAYARQLLKKGGEDREKALYHLKRSYSPGDPNREAQILHGRELFLAELHSEAEQVFHALGSSPHGAGGRNLRLFPLPGRFYGYVKRIEVGYGFITWDKVGRPLYFSRKDSDPSVFDTLSSGSRVSFEIAFNSRGPVARSLRPQK